MNDSQLPNVGGIVADWLVANGYDGLRDPFDFNGCSCSLDGEDLLSCEKFNFGSCVPYRKGKVQIGNQ